MRLSRSTPLIARESTLLALSNDWTVSMGAMLVALRDYPQQNKFLIRTNVNIGYRCGLLHSLAATQKVWQRFLAVLSTHPDVYFFPPAFSLIGREIDSAQHAGNISLLASPTKMFWYGAHHRPMAFLADAFVFLVPALRAHARMRRRAQKDSSSSGGGGGGEDDGGKGAAISRGKNVTAGYGAWIAPSGAGRHTWSPFWEEASDYCATSYHEKRGLIKPEQAIHHVATAQLHIGVRALRLARTTQWRRTQRSRDGVMHSHNTSAVRRLLTQAQTVMALDTILEGASMTASRRVLI